MIHTGQVTIPAGGVIALATQRTSVLELIVQNNSAHTIRVGDNTITAANAKGLLIAASNAAPGPMAFRPGSGSFVLDLAQTFVTGTAGDLVDFAYVR